MWVHPLIERVPVRYSSEKPSRTKQSFKDATDINAIMRKYLVSGVVPTLNPAAPMFGDFTDVGDYHSCLVRVRNAEAAFLELPSHVRDAVGNDPEQLLALVTDPERRAEAEELGLFEKAAAVVEAPVEPLEPAVAPPAAPGGPPAPAQPAAPGGA